MSRILYLVYTSIIFVFITNNIYANYYENERYVQDFLFLIEEAYTQRQNEIQFAMMGSYFHHNVEIEKEIEDDEVNITKNKTNQFESIYEIEYGITDRLQVEAEFSYVDISKNTNEHKYRHKSIGNTSLGLSYALIKENNNLPEIAVGLEIAAPTENKRKSLGILSKNWHYGSFIGLSKAIQDNLFLHLRAEYETIRNVKTTDGKIDEHEIGLGAALVYKYSPRWEFILESLFEQEIEISSSAKEYSNSLYLAPAIKYSFMNDVQIGISYAKNINADGFNWGVLSRIQYEFDL